MIDPTSRRQIRRGRNSLCVVAAAFALSVAAVAEAGDHTLYCGVPLTSRLESGVTDEYELRGFGSAAVVVDAIDVSGSIGNLMIGDDSNRTCGGSVSLGAGHREMSVADCIDADSGLYTIVANVVSQGPTNCSQTIPCGQFPFVRQLVQAGQVDSYSFVGSQGDQVSLRATDVRGVTGGMRIRLFDAEGMPLTDTCSGSLNTSLAKGGVYTVLISSCAEPAASTYLLSFASPSCPSGPEITHFGLAQADGTPLSPAGFDEAGRPVFARDFGAAFLLVVEGRPGSSGAAVGNTAYEYSTSDASVLPDLQVLLSRSLGNGSAAVCDKSLPNIGGVPASPALAFISTPAVAAAINDFGCRVDNGAGAPFGVGAQDACTSFASGDFGFVEPSSSIQFCMIMSQPWAFQRGRTTVRARLRDVEGNLGWPREMVVQVGNSTTDPCTGDCDGDREVTVDEIINGVRIAIGDLVLASCTEMDANSDGSVTVDELVAAVTNALTGCSETAAVSSPEP